MKIVKITMASVTRYYAYNHSHIDYDCTDRYSCKYKYLACLSDEDFENLKQNQGIANHRITFNDGKSTNKLVEIDYICKTIKEDRTDIHMYGVRFSMPTLEEEFIAKSILNIK